MENKWLVLLPMAFFLIMGAKAKEHKDQVRWNVVGTVFFVIYLAMLD